MISAWSTLFIWKNSISFNHWSDNGLPLLYQGVPLGGDHVAEAIVQILDPLMQLLGKPLQKLLEKDYLLTLECLQADAAAKGKHTPGNRGTPKAFPWNDPKRGRPPTARHLIPAGLQWVCRLEHRHGGRGLDQRGTASKGRGSARLPQRHDHRQEGHPDRGAEGHYRFNVDWGRNGIFRLANEKGTPSGNHEVPESYADYPGLVWLTRVKRARPRATTTVLARRHSLWKPESGQPRALGKSRYLGLCWEVVRRSQPHFQRRRRWSSFGPQKETAWQRLTRKGRQEGWQKGKTNSGLGREGRRDCLNCWKKAGY